MGKKEWHVGRPENIERVRRDEERHQERVEQRLSQTTEARLGSIYAQLEYKKAKNATNEIARPDQPSDSLPENYPKAIPASRATKAGSEEERLDGGQTNKQPQIPEHNKTLGELFKKDHRISMPWYSLPSGAPDLRYSVPLSTLNTLQKAQNKPSLSEPKSTTLKAAKLRSISSSSSEELDIPRESSSMKSSKHKKDKKDKKDKKKRRHRSRSRSKSPKHQQSQTTDAATELQRLRRERTAREEQERKRAAALVRNTRD